MHLRQGRRQSQLEKKRVQQPEAVAQQTPTPMPKNI